MYGHGTVAIFPATYSDSTNWCAREESNLHPIAETATSTLRGCRYATGTNFTKYTYFNKC